MLNLYKGYLHDTILIPQREKAEIFAAIKKVNTDVANEATLYRNEFLNKILELRNS